MYTTLKIGEIYEGGLFSPPPHTIGDMNIEHIIRSLPETEKKCFIAAKWEWVQPLHILP